MPKKRVSKDNSREKRKKRKVVRLNVNEFSPIKQEENEWRNLTLKCLGKICRIPRHWKKEQSLIVQLKKKVKASIKIHLQAKWKDQLASESEFQTIPPSSYQNRNNETKFFPVDSYNMRNHGFIYSLRNENILLFKKTTSKYTFNPCKHKSKLYHHS